MCFINTHRSNTDERNVNEGEEKSKCDESGRITREHMDLQMIADLTEDRRVRCKIS